MDTLEHILTRPPALAAAVAVGTFVVVAGPSYLFRRWLGRVLANTRMGSPSSLTAAAFIAVAIMATLLLLIVFTMSYAALYDAATWLQDTSLTWINGGDLRFLFPLGIDLVIVFFLVLDLLMEWKHTRAPLNRFVVYFLSGSTVALNVAQGDGLLSYATHAMPPLAVIAIAEGIATWVRHLANLNDPDAVLDRVPLGRFLAHPLSTLRVVRVMVGWQIKSYKRALELEMLCQACWALLRAHYGGRLRARRKTPGHIRWLLGAGMQPHAAYPLVASLVDNTITFIPSTDITPPPLRGTGEAELTNPPATPAPEPMAPHTPTAEPEPTPAAPGEPELVLTYTDAVIGPEEGWRVLFDDSTVVFTEEELANPAPEPERAPEPTNEPSPTPAPAPPAPAATPRPAPPTNTTAPTDTVRSSLDRLVEMIDSGDLPADTLGSAERIRSALRCRKNHADAVRRLYREKGAPVAA